ncbi:MAG: elongation factor G [Hyphomicrobiales bacterium]|nr:MAG: elongation factor G [Hyphomicrobiales bacterium]
MGQSAGGNPRGPRCIALVGPYLSGKTSLLEAILERTGAITRAGTVNEGNTVGDSSPEARAHNMSVEINAATTSFMDESYTFIDCPGSVEFLQDMKGALPAVDAAIVVCEPDEKKVPALQLILKSLEDAGVPHFLFLNKIDNAAGHVRDTLAALQEASANPLVLRQIPIWKNGIATGFVDLALERAYVYHENAASEVVNLPEDVKDRESEARFHMLEQLADYDDEMMEQLLEDMEPPRDKIFDDLSQDLEEGVICPVFLGSALNGNGIFRLLKALRHETPFVDRTAARLGAVAGAGETIVQIIKTFHTTHGGKLSLARVLAGQVKDSMMLTGPGGRTERVSGVFAMLGQEPKKTDDGEAGATVALGRMDAIETGMTLSSAKAGTDQLPQPAEMAPVFGSAVEAKERKDEVKLTSAIAKVLEEDPSLILEHNQDTNQMVLWGQGDIHLKVAMEKLQGKYGIEVERLERKVPYKETIRKKTEVRGRHKKQSGGHGQFGDVVIDIRPQPRGNGFEFTESISGGVVPRQYIPSVELGVRDYMRKGPLGFPVVDIAVNLKDGSYHTVDSSDMAFRTAGRIAMTEGMPQCAPVLLEPVVAVEIYVPSDATAKINGIISSKRGQILGFDNRPGWPGWDAVNAQIPESEIGNLIVEIRSATAGAGTFKAEFDHLAELTGRLADQVVEARAAENE